jgi:predicted DNA-binding antitoxin AbrB/MazE fold protein
MGNGTHVRAVHRDGVLELLTPLQLPEGARVSVIVLETPSNEADRPQAVELAYPTRLVPADRLDKLTNLVEIGGDALADSEALYD